MRRCLKTKISIPSKALGERQMWSDPILIETTLPGTFVQWKDAKQDPLPWEPKLQNPLFYLILDTKTTSLVTVSPTIWKVIATVLTTRFRIQQILRKWRKIGAATIFHYFFVFLTNQKGASGFHKFCEICEKSWSQPIVALYDFLSLLRSHLPERASKFI